MQIEGLKVTDYIKTEGASDQLMGVGTSGIKDDKKPNLNKELKALSVDNAYYNNKGVMTDEDFAKEVNEASALGVSTVDKIKNVERAWDEEATAKTREDGHDPMDMEPETLITVVDEIKMNLAKAGADVSKMGGLSDAEIEAMSGSIAQAVAMTKGLSDTLPEEVQAYLVKNELEPTITNIYNATYSAPAKAPEESNDEDIISLIELVEGKVHSLIEEIESEDFRFARNPVPPVELKNMVATMLKQDVPVTKEHLEYMVQLEQYEKPSEENIVNAISDILAEGKEPTEAYLIEGYSLMDQAKKTFEEVMGMDVNDLASVTAQRQLTEIQLTMTVEATFTMMKNGISVNTNDLSDLLDKLKLQETNLLQILMKDKTGEKTDSNVSLFKEVMNEMAEIQSAPAAAFGRFSNIGMETFSYVHEVSVSVTAEYSRMEMTYEAVGTEVRKDLGDSINKAFQNVDDILADLDIEATESSQKAVRILAYNQMEITQESVTSMKAQTELVNRTFKSMTPAVVSEMIKRGNNPLDMTMNDLKEMAENIKAEMGSTSDEEGYAKFLWKAEHNSEISAEEREAYVGVYRLLHQVEKSDGAAIGALISQGTEVTLRNLMTAVRSSKHTGKEYEVSDKYGSLDEMVVRDLSITEQVEKVFLTNRCRDAKEAMTPAKMHILGEENILGMNPDEFAAAMEAEAVSTDTSADKLQEQAYNQYLTSQLKEALSASQEVESVLQQFNIPTTANMINAVQALMQNNSTVIKDLYGRAAKQEDMTIEDLINLTLERFDEACHSPKAMKEAEEALGDLAERVMKSMVEMEDVRTVDLENMKLVIQQAKAIQEMANSGETYHIPMMIDNEVGNMNLRIVRGVEETGLVKMAIYLQSTGIIETTFRYEAQEVTANVECDTAEMRDRLAGLADSIAEKMKAETGFSFSFSFIRESGISVNDVYNWELGNFQVAEANENEKNEIQTEALYSIARSYLSVIGEMF
ncbi:DUF6240 domain-containing protein [Pseudobutyrivibrio xylanivorans]|uniref:Flagellar hook-length control protein FliK n=1 Tax=Pseudobutyrivibrio xylanivorans TaxID=185007 RepID=A0A1G5RXV4_PSEXY|nr:DUF6240 domain-containing protein [Pseudobutyrivibrio xylanivorans]SCZ78873.1 hypothetical protein SAMN02910350_01491 [Pseudobutyrivibrio xylanivorans]